MLASDLCRASLLLCMSSYMAKAALACPLGRVCAVAPQPQHLFRVSCAAVQTKFHRRVRIGAPSGEVHELWALFQTLDTLDGAGSTHARDFVHGALHPDPRARMSPAEMCLHPFMEEARDALLAQRHQQSGKSPAEWRAHIEQLRVRTPTAKGRGADARAVSSAFDSPCAGCWQSCWAYRVCS